MIRATSLFVLLAIAGAAHAQEKDPLAALRENADKTSTTWETLAKGLEAKIATLLPCDPKYRAAVEEVSHASDARMATLSAYLKAAATKAKEDTESAKRVLATQAALAGGWNTERTEADQQGTAVEAQVADLKESMRKRGTLAGAEQVLIEIAGLVKQRAAKSEEQASHRDVLTTMLGDLVIAYQERQTALENESAQADAEAAKWNAYYAARFSRAITECTIINAGRTPRQRKQP
jgi:hypothetical protein